MNAITNALEEIKQQIPAEILYVGFSIDDNPNVKSLDSLDEKIMHKLMRPRVLTDCDIVGGPELTIPLDNVPPQYHDDFYTVYKVPPHLLGNRTIVSALNLTYIPYRGHLSNGQMPGSMPGVGQQSVLTSVTQRIANTFSDDLSITNARLDLIGHNTVSVYANFRMLTSYGLRCIVTNDEKLQNISVRSYKNFAMLSVIAVKAYLYNTLIIKINQGYLSGGQELGQFKSTLESYEGCWQEYNVFLKEVWTSTAFMNETPRFHRLIKSMINPGL